MCGWTTVSTTPFTNVTREFLTISSEETKSIRGRHISFIMPHVVTSQVLWYISWARDYIEYRADSRLVPSQWETLQNNALSHWLGANLESALEYTHNIFYRHMTKSSKYHITILHICITPLLIVSDTLESHNYIYPSQGPENFPAHYSWMLGSHSPQ